jgi:Uma2 family endonuclease
MKGHAGRFLEKVTMYTRRMPVVYETETPHATRSELGPYREADYVELPDQPRCELLYGRLPVTPAPTVRHQFVVMAIGRFLHELAQHRDGYAVASPVDVVLAEHSIVQPDVIYVSRERAGILRDRVEGAPDLVVEVLSPVTARRDLGEKLRLYAESGVSEYWIVDPQLETFEFLENTPAGFRVRLPEGAVYRSAATAGLELDLEAFWRAVPS